MSEIKMVMENHGMSVDYRHMMLLSAQMTHTGEVLGITRHGLAKMKQSVLNLASVSNVSKESFPFLYESQYYSLKKQLITYLMQLITVKQTKLAAFLKTL